MTRSKYLIVVPWFSQAAISLRGPHGARGAAMCPFYKKGLFCAPSE
jgi:hypothetical protein